MLRQSWISIFYHLAETAETKEECNEETNKTDTGNPEEDVSWDVLEEMEEGELKETKIGVK